MAYFTSKSWPRGADILNDIFKICHDIMKPHEDASIDVHLAKISCFAIKDEDEGQGREARFTISLPRTGKSAHEAMTAQLYEKIISENLKDFILGGANLDFLKVHGKFPTLHISMRTKGIMHVMLHLSTGGEDYQYRETNQTTYNGSKLSGFDDIQEFFDDLDKLASMQTHESHPEWVVMSVNNAYKHLHTYHQPLQASLEEHAIETARIFKRETKDNTLNLKAYQGSLSFKKEIKFT